MLLLSWRHLPLAAELRSLSFRHKESGGLDGSKPPLVVWACQKGCWTTAFFLLPSFGNKKHHIQKRIYAKKLPFFYIATEVKSNLVAHRWIHNLYLIRMAPPTAHNKGDNMRRIAWEQGIVSCLSTGRRARPSAAIFVVCCMIKPHFSFQHLYFIPEFYPLRCWQATAIWLK